VANDTYVLFSYTIQDRFGTKTTTQVPGYVEASTMTVAGLKTEWTTVGTDIDAISDAMLIGGRVNVVFPADGAWKDTPGADSFDERTGVFNFFNDATKYKFGIKIPSISNAVLANGKIDLSNADVAALIAALVTVFTHGEFVNPGLHTLVALADAFLAARKYRKQLDRSSFEPGS
jgi:hypothetical protein